MIWRPATVSSATLSTSESVRNGAGQDKRPRGRRGGRKHRAPRPDERPRLVGCPACGAEPGHGCLNARWLSRGYHDARYLRAARAITHDPRRSSGVAWPDRKQIDHDHNEGNLPLEGRIDGGAIRIAAYGRKLVPNDRKDRS